NAFTALVDGRKLQKIKMGWKTVLRIYFLQSDFEPESVLTQYLCDALSLLFLQMLSVRFFKLAFFFVFVSHF
ncbi:MAG TPA: hypothetical protein PKX08_00810, partial [Cyclobacteriaceae bacterium]|nr:hypothetical protein [Cyclobacteriaceae bacterium]